MAAAYGPTFLYGMAEGALLPVIVLRTRELGGSLTEAAVLLGVLGLGSLLFSLPSSALVNRYGERGALVGAAMVGAVASGAAAYAPSVLTLGAAVLVVGASGSVFKLARQSYLVAVVPFERRALALSTLGGVMRIGTLAGPALGSVVIAIVGIRGGFLVATAALAVATPTSLLLRAHSSRSTPSTPGMWRVISEHSGVLATVGSSALLVNAVRGARQAALPLWAAHVGLDPATVSLVFAASAAADAVVFAPGGWAMDRWGRLWVAVPAMLVMGVGLVVLPLTSTVAGVATVAVVLGIGNGLTSGVVMTIGADYAPPDARPSFLGAWRFLSDIGVVGGPAFVSAATAALGLATGVVASGGIGLLAAGALLLSVRRRPPSAPPDRRAP